jgi:predicted Zn-dependent protease
MAFKTDIKKKEIRIQKQAQSLTAFQSKVAIGYDDRAALMKRLLAAAAAVLVALAAAVAWKVWRSHKIEQHETALAALLVEVQGDKPKPPDASGALGAPGAPEQLQRMQAALPRLEELARTAPGPCAPVANGLLATWRLALGPDGVDGAGKAAAPKDAWSRLRLAQRSVALGLPQEALDLVSGLHKKAKPDQAWSGQYWTMLMQIRQLEGNRAQALKDYAEYRLWFKGRADVGALDKALEGV